MRNTTITVHDIVDREAERGGLWLVVAAGTVAALIALLARFLLT